MVAVAFVLLADPTPPTPASFVQAAAELGCAMTHDGGTQSPVGFKIVKGGGVSIMLVDAPHPDAPGMLHGIASPSAAEVARASAHLILALTGGPSELRAQDTLLATLTAASVRACGSAALGAMLGHGRCVHRADFFANVVADDPGELPLLVCVDVTRAAEPDERMSLLSHGLTRYGREELFVTASKQGKGALDFVLSMAGWLLADPDKHLPTGDTVGRSETERVEVRRVPSPLGEGPEVVLLELDR
jgi:hypothetical protein